MEMTGSSLETRRSLLKESVEKVFADEDFKMQYTLFGLPDCPPAAPDSEIDVRCYIMKEGTYLGYVSYGDSEITVVCMDKKYEGQFKQAKKVLKDGGV